GAGVAPGPHRGASDAETARARRLAREGRERSTRAPTSPVVPATIYEKKRPFSDRPAHPASTRPACQGAVVGSPQSPGSQPPTRPDPSPGPSDPAPRPHAAIPQPPSSASPSIDASGDASIDGPESPP